jgi:hypothetical protein
VPSLLSFKGGRGGTVSKALYLMRRFKTPVTLSATHDLHAASSRHPGSCHVSAVSASSYVPLTACVNMCRWRAHQLLGAPDPSLPREGAFAGQALGSYYRCTGYWGIVVHLLLGHFQWPSFGLGAQ